MGSGFIYSFRKCYSAPSWGEGFSQVTGSKGNHNMCEETTRSHTTQMDTR
jgi:hypothetical protein